MKVMISKDYEAMSKLAMQHLIGYMLLRQNRVNLAITAGATPIRTYELLAEEVKEKAYFKHVHYYNFDEIPHKIKAQEGITISDLRKLYLNPAQIPEEQIHALNEHNYIGQDERIRQDGGLDMILLGIGMDGHFCGNLPGTTLFSHYTTKVDCDERLKGTIRSFYEEEADIPDFYITMGPASIMEAKHLVLIANGVKKAEIMKKWFETDVDIHLPASILKLHPNLTVIMDQEAASLL